MGGSGDSGISIEFILIYLQSRYGAKVISVNVGIINLYSETVNYLSPTSCSIHSNYYIKITK